MKRIAWIFGAAVLAAVLLVALLVALLPRETLKARLGEQIAAWTGRDVSLRGEPEISLFPELTVTLKDVQVGGPSGMDDAAIIAMERLKGTVRILPLIIGRVEIGSFTMVRPRIHLVSDDAGARNWEFDSGAAALQLAFSGDVPLGDFQLQDGTLLYENRRTGISQRFDSLNVKVDWSSVRQPIEISGSAIWGGEAVEFSATAEAPFAFINGEATPVEAHLRSAPITMDFSGEAAELDAIRLSGELGLVAPSLRGFAAWLGSPVGPGSTLGPASLAGAATLQNGVLSVEDARLALDGNSATGALALTIGVKPDIAGTLAFEALDLTPYFTALRSGQASSPTWQDARISTDWFEDIGADIRLSAGSVSLGALRFGEAAASVSLREATLEIGVAQAQLHGGSLAGDLTVSDGEEAQDTSWIAQLRAANLDLDPMAQQLGLSADLSGRLTVTTDVTMEGQYLGSMFASLDGTSMVDLRDGAVPLFGIAEIAAAGPGAAASDGIEAVEPTAVSEMTASLSFSGGTAFLEQASVATETFTAEAKGRIGLAEGALSLAGTVQPAAAVAAPVPFAIEGTIRSPVTRSAALAN